MPRFFGLWRRRRLKCNYTPDTAATRRRLRGRLQAAELGFLGNGTLVTRIGGRVRDRHAREVSVGNPQDHSYLTFAPHYFESRRPFWVTEFANWHSQADGGQVDAVAKQTAQMSEMVAICEARADVIRYACFTGRWDNDIHHTSLLGAPDRLPDLGRHYISLPF